MPLNALPPDERLKEEEDVDREIQERDNRRLTTRLRFARLKQPASLEDLDLKRVTQPGKAPQPGKSALGFPITMEEVTKAAGGDIVVLAAVNPGAEVIADGSIHVYAPLKGRALAGARGDTSARIFTTQLEAELVSIAGVYRTFESAPDAAVAKKPAQIRLADSSQLVIEPL